MREGEPENREATNGLAEEVVLCAERTLAAPSARMLYLREVDLHWPERPRRRRRGGLLGPVGRALKLAGKGAWKRATHDLDFRRLEAEGFVEPAARRYMLDFGSFAELYEDGDRWAGRSGRARSTLERWPRDRHGVHVWWPLDALRGTTRANLEGEDTFHGDRCRKMGIQVDIGRASALKEEGLRPPTVRRFEVLLAFPMTVWIDDQHVRCVRFTEGDDAESTYTLELWDYGVSTSDLDWSRLPTFRSPDEAESVAARAESRG